MDKKQGDLSQTGLPRLLHLIYKRGDPAAALDISRDPIKKRFFFENGIPVGATSNILGEVLGRLLIEEGIITQEQYEKTLETVLEEKRKHGEVLTSMGLISPDQLDQFLSLQLKRRLLKIFGWNEGTYHYIKNEPLPGAMTPYPIHPATLILEGISLGFYPVKRVEQDLEPYLETILTPSAKPSIYTLDDFNPNIQERRFLERFDGERTLNEIIATSDLLRHRVLSLSLSFIITSLVVDKNEEVEPDLLVEEEEEEEEASEAAGSARLNAEILFVRAKSALADGDYRGAVKTLREITELSPAEGEYLAYLGWATYLNNPDEPAAAEKIMKQALELNNELDSAWFFLAKIALASDETDLAENALRTAVEKNPWMLEAVVEMKRLELAKTTVEPEDASLRAAYIEHYDLAADPFTPVPEPRYLLESKGLDEAVTAVAAAVRQNAGPILLKGAAGVGVTTAALELLTKFFHEKLLVAFLLTPPEKELQMVKDLNAEVGSTTDSTAIKDALLNLGMRVSQNKVQGGRTVFIIDQAHLLSRGCMKLVQYLARLKTLQIVLLAEPGFEEMLKDEDYEELDRKLTSRITLAPLSVVETGEYITKRLSVAPRTGAAPLTPILLADPASKIVHDVSDGVPAEINRKAAVLLAKAAELDTCVLDEKVANAAFGIVAPDIPVEGKEHEESFEELDLADLGEIAFDETEPTGPVPFAPSEPLSEILPDASILEEASVVATHEPHEMLTSEPGPPEPVDSDLSEPPPTPPDKAPAEKHDQGGYGVSVGKGRGEEEPEKDSTDRKGPRTPKKKKRSPVKLIILLVLVVIAGLVAGSLTRVFYWPGPAPQKTPAPPATPLQGAGGPAAGGMEMNAPLAGTTDMAPLATTLDAAPLATTTGSTPLRSLEQSPEDTEGKESGS